MPGQQHAEAHRGMIDSVTNIRASVMLMTCITILAVDFQASDPNG